MMMEMIAVEDDNMKMALLNTMPTVVMAMVMMTMMKVKTISSG